MSLETGTEAQYMTVTDPTTPEPTAEKQPLVLTEREIAIAQGIDPDAAPEVTDENPVKDEPTGEGKDALETPEPVAGRIEAAWLTPEVEREAETYGLTKDELLELGDEESYKRTKRVLDKHLFAAGQQVRQPPAPAAPAAPAASPAKPATEPEFARHDLEKLKKEGYDESTLALYAQQNKMLDRIEADQKRVAQVEAFHQQALHAQHVQEFNTTADTIDEELFGRSYKDGKPVKLGKDHDENRRKLYDVAETIVAGIFAKADAAGKEPNIPPMPVLLLRARDYAFADQIRARGEAKAKAEAADKAKKLAAQSRQRRPAGRPTQTAPTVAVEPDNAKRIANRPEIIKFFQQAQEENGVAA